ncbi:MAG: glucosamine 6-phosphate synthetase [Gammaproteobacteria bacterium]|nr:glucosamine 6-phosphate synthetase [Gammaproteobacteria bacterium]
MCGIFGIVNPGHGMRDVLRTLASHAEQRGCDASGLAFHRDGGYHVWRSYSPVRQLVRGFDPEGCAVAVGHSRLITSGEGDNQPIVRNGVCVLHNGIVVNDAEAWVSIGDQPRQRIDTEVIAAIAAKHLRAGGDPARIDRAVLEICHGVVACAMVVPMIGKLVLFSNNGSLYVGNLRGATCISSEAYPLREIGCSDVRQVTDQFATDIPQGGEFLERAVGGTSRTRQLVPALISTSAEERMLEYPRHELRRCTRCILPSTMPYIVFDSEGICNYCHHYRLRNVPRPMSELQELVAPYRRSRERDCIVPFSGGRDSCYSLHVITKELDLRPIAYTYDWGMVTDLGRRNISRMCSALGVENIIVAADIAAKRNNIRRNLIAWLKSPDLGMVSILTAGDKHFFRHVETVKRQTGIQLNIWGVNPLEVTYFKAGFLGIPPDFAERRVYAHGWTKQLRYQSRRICAMLRSPGYINSSLWDTLSGEYHRSFTRKEHYYHLFDYARWDEPEVDRVLAEYDWEKAPDTTTTWRIGDGTAAFYNYIYYTVAGFTEHDTFRSNQVREGDLKRDQALKLVRDENRPRYPNIKWYLDALQLDFGLVIAAINRIPRLYAPCAS